MRLYVKNKFPCGCETEFEISTLFGDLKFDSKITCPLHGSKCKRGKKK
jgi:hypothetical protein